MTESRPTTAQGLTELLRDFMQRVREHFANEATEGDAEVVIDRLFAALSAILGALLMVLPLGQRKDRMADILLAAAVRLWNRKGTLS